MIRVTVSLIGFEEAQRRLANISSSPPRIVRGAKFFATKRFQEGLRYFTEEAPKGPTGDLSKSVVLELEDSGNTLKGAYTSKALYAGWVSRGTGVFGPFNTPIVPTHAKHLLYFWHKQGLWMLSAHVKGQPANPFMIRARKRVKDMVFSILPRDVREDIRIIVGGK